MSLCKVCQKKLPCYAHCQETRTGNHLPNWNSIAMADGGMQGTSVILDVWCHKCGQSGSISIDASTQEVHWD